MKKLLILLSVLICFAMSGSVSAISLIGSGITVPSCALMNEPFDGSDGTDITAAGWTADGDDPGDWIELDTAIKRTGTAAVLIDPATASADRKVYKAFTEQTSGSFVVKFYCQTSDTEVPIRRFLHITDSTPDDVVQLRFNSADLDYNDGAWDKIADIVATTFYGIKVTLDVTAHTFDVDLDSNNDGTFDTSVSSAQPFINNVNPSRIYLLTVDSSLATTTVTVDDLCIE